MHDIRAIRDNPAAFDAGLKTRFLPAQADDLIALDAKRRDALSRQQEAETGRNALSKQIGAAKAKGDEAEFERLRAEVDRLKDVLAEAGQEADLAEAELKKALEVIPNLPEDGVPIGEDETGNEEVRRWGEPREISFTPKDHTDLGEGLGWLDFDAAAKISGARFAVLKGGLARLERALAQFMLDLHTSEHGYTEVSPPYMVRGEAMFGTGQLPKFKEDLYKISFFDRERMHQDIQSAVNEALTPEVLDAFLNRGLKLAQEAPEGIDRKEFIRGVIDHEVDPFRKSIKEELWAKTRSGEYQIPMWLIPTAEVPLTNLAREAIQSEADLPLRMTAFTPCFRAEAGSAGRDTRGLIRQHQFHKVEMVSIVRPEDSADELDRMTGCAEEVLKRLELPYRTMLLSTGDMGFSAKRTYDLEVWLPSQDTYREISSCSNCGDFQARRMNARFRREGEKKPEFLHTLNGSGVAVGRALLAVMENHQNADGSVTIPDALRPYMGGQERLAK